MRTDLAVPPVSYTRHRFPAESNRHCVWRYHRFGLGLRGVHEQPPTHEPRHGSPGERGRCSARRKPEVVLRVRRGATLAARSREPGVTAATSAGVVPASGPVEGALGPGAGRGRWPRGVPC